MVSRDRILLSKISQEVFWIGLPQQPTTRRRTQESYCTQKELLTVARVDYFDEPANVSEFDSSKQTGVPTLKESKIILLVNLCHCQHSSVSIHQLEF